MSTSKKLKPMSIERAIELIERDHGGCDQNTCDIAVALRHGFDLVAIDSWLGSGAASEEFNNVEVDYSQSDLNQQRAEFCDSVSHVDCPYCNAVLWDPEDCDYHCDSCANDIPKPKGVTHE